MGIFTEKIVDSDATRQNKQFFHRNESRRSLRLVGLSHSVNKGEVTKDALESCDFDSQ